MTDTALKAFDQPDEIREFPYGRFEIVQIAGVKLGRATYQPGWKWSLHNAPTVGTKLCYAPHTGTVLSGHGVVEYEDGVRLDLLPGAVFHITSTPHDSWVEGDAPYVSLHILARQHAEKPSNLSVQAATKFELIINLKTAMSLDISIPSSQLARADEVIEQQALFAAVHVDMPPVPPMSGPGGIPEWLAHSLASESDPWRTSSSADYKVSLVNKPVLRRSE